MSASTTPIISKGILLKTCATQNGSYTTLANINDVKQPKQTLEKVDATEYDSGLIVRKPGFLDCGDVALKLFYTYANVVALLALLGVENQWYEIVFKDATGWQFQGFLSELGGDGPIKGMVTNDAVITITSVPTQLAS